jgi:hypothetical protein
MPPAGAQRAEGPHDGRDPPDPDSVVTRQRLVVGGGAHAHPVGSEPEPANQQDEDRDGQGDGEPLVSAEHDQAGDVSQAGEERRVVSHVRSPDQVEHGLQDQAEADR